MTLEKKEKLKRYLVVFRPCGYDNNEFLSIEVKADSFESAEEQARLDQPLLSIDHINEIS